MLRALPDFTNAAAFFALTANFARAAFCAAVGAFLFLVAILFAFFGFTY